MKIPEFHFHEKSRSYVYGIKLDDGCSICEKFKDLVEDRTKSHVLCVCFSEEFAEKALNRYLNNQKIFEINTDSKPIKSNFEIKEFYEPTKEDKVRWKKQFSYILPKLTKNNELTYSKSLVSEEEKNDMIDASLSEAKVNSSGQSMLFGEIVENKKKRKK